PVSLTVPTLTLGLGGTTLNLELNSAGNPAVPLVNVTGANGFTPGGGSNTINVINSQLFAVGQFPLIDYSGTAITSGFTPGPLPARPTGALFFNTANTSIDLQITAVDSIRWNGDLSANWDVGAAVGTGGTNNWRLSSNPAVATNFVTSDSV